MVLLPVYWILHSVAALRAARELIVASRCYWAKTTHGVTRLSRKGAQAVVAQQARHCRGFRPPYRLRPRSAVSMSGVFPATRSASSWPEPAAMVQPSVPWPVLR